MTFKEYRTLTSRTLPDLGEIIHNTFVKNEPFDEKDVDKIENNSLKLNLSHMVLGLNSEIKELVDCVGLELKVASKVDLVNLGEELGDIYWFISNYLNIRDLIAPEELTLGNYDEDECLDVLIFNIGEITDIVKKFVAYNKPIDKMKELEYTYGILVGLELFERAYSLDGNHIREKNINKLRARYPEKFEEVKAINRDLDKERKELE